MWPTEESWLTFSAQRRPLIFSSASLRALGLRQWVLADVFAGKKRPENEVDHAHLVSSLRIELQKYWNRTTGRLAHDTVTIPTLIYVRMTLTAYNPSLRCKAIYLNL